MLGETEAKNLCQKVLMRCGANPAEALILVEDSALTRFANNTIHQNVAERNVNLIVHYLNGKRKGIASTNRLDDAALDDLVAHAQASARVSLEDPDYPGLPDPATYTRAVAYDIATAEASPEMRARAVGVVCQIAAEKKLNASGAFSTGSGELAVANSQGLFAHYASTNADFQTVVMSTEMGEDSSGYAKASGWRAADIPVEDLGRDAIHKAEMGRNPRKVEPGVYTVVFDPYVTYDLVGMLNMNGMGAQAVLEGRSWMNDRTGQQAMSRLVNIWDDGLDPAGIPTPFDFEGVPKQRVEIVKNGMVMGPVYDRYTGARAGKPSTGHALPSTMRSFGPIAANLFMSAGVTSTADMIRSTERGLYVTRFWYTRLVHPRDCVITGMTRDGVYMIEKGELAYPVKNLRFTQSYVEALNNIEIIGSEERLQAEEFGGVVYRTPALKISQFNFTGSTV